MQLKIKFILGEIKIHFSEESQYIPVDWSYDTIAPIQPMLMWPVPNNITNEQIGKTIIPARSSSLHKSQVPRAVIEISRARSASLYLNCDKFANSKGRNTVLT